MGEPSPSSRHWFSAWRRRHSKTESHDPKPKHGLGMLDTRRVLEETFVKTWDSRDVEKEVKQEFPQVRLAVFGRSGVGKSTLIRLIIGSEAAAVESNISHGTAGTQDINDEWRLADPDLPLLIHDSNGMDVKGQERVDTIKKFLDKHQQSGNVSERIHLVWYVISAIDRRFLDDGDVLRLVCSYEIPFLLIITHKDCVVKGKEFVTDSMLDKLLEGVSDKASVKKHMVTVGNGVRVENGQFIEEDVDHQALLRLHKTTKKLIDSKRRYVWAAAQARDMQEKLQASASLIVNYVRSSMVTSIVTPAIPIAEQTKVVFLFDKVLTALVKIWRAPPNLRTVLSKDIAFPEGKKSLLADSFRSVVTAAGIAVTVAATTLTAGLALPSLLAWLGVSGVVNSKCSTVLLLGYSCVILGCILYVKAHQKSSKLWDSEVSINDYRILCKAFAESKYQKDLPNRVKQIHSSWDTLLGPERQKGKIQSQIVEFYKELLKMSPRSLNSQLEVQKAQEKGQAMQISDLANSEKVQEKAQNSTNVHESAGSEGFAGAYRSAEQQRIDGSNDKTTNGVNDEGTNTTYVANYERKEKFSNDVSDECANTSYDENYEEGQKSTNVSKMCIPHKISRVPQKMAGSLLHPTKHAAITSRPLRWVPRGTNQTLISTPRERFGGASEGEVQERTDAKRDQRLDISYKENDGTSYDRSTIRVGSKDEICNNVDDECANAHYDEPYRSKNTKSNKGYDEDVNVGYDEDGGSGYDEDVNIGYD